jgi:hypothetical protein
MRSEVNAHLASNTKGAPEGAPFNVSDFFIDSSSLRRLRSLPGLYWQSNSPPRLERRRSGPQQLRTFCGSEHSCSPSGRLCEPCSSAPWRTSRDHAHPLEVAEISFFAAPPRRCRTRPIDGSVFAGLLPLFKKISLVHKARFYPISRLYSAR